jgi:hypothetical protein
MYMMINEAKASTAVTGNYLSNESFVKVLE